MLAFGLLSVAITSNLSLNIFTYVGEKVNPISIFEFAEIIPSVKSNLKF